MSYKVLNLGQGSDEWIKARFDYITASQVPVLLGLSPYQSPIELFEEKLMRLIVPPKGEKEVLFAKGHAVELKAREWCNRELKTEFKPMVLVSNKLPELMASLDGFNVGSNTILEVKYVGATKLKEISEGNIPIHHSAQVQSQLLVSGAGKCIYFASDGISSVRQDVLPDHAEFEIIAQEVQAFAKRLKDGNPPELTDQDFLVVEDADLELLKLIKHSLGQWEQRFEETKAKILDKYKDNKRVKGHGVSIVSTLRKGTIQYKGIEVLKSIDLEKYRSKPSVVTTVRFEKDVKE